MSWTRPKPPAETPHFIYHVLDEFERVGYVGKSTNPYRRLKDHMAADTGVRMRAWIRGILSRGAFPRVRIVSLVRGDDVFKERDEVIRCLLAGHTLINEALTSLERAKMLLFDALLGGM